MQLDILTMSEYFAQSLGYELRHRPFSYFPSPQLRPEHFAEAFIGELFWLLTRGTSAGTRGQPEVCQFASHIDRVCDGYRIARRFD